MRGDGAVDQRAVRLPWAAVPGAVLTAPLDRERRAGVAILVTTRWTLIGMALFTVNYRPNVSAAVLTTLNVLVVAAALLNVLLQRQLVSDRAVPLALPLLASLFDAIAVTVAIGLVEGFTNQSFVLYYPALLAFSAVFPGRWSVGYAALMAVAYVAVCLTAGGTFRPGGDGDQRVLVLRLAAMAATVAIANLVMRVERTRREQAVAAEAARVLQVQRLEEHTRALERSAAEERRRLSREVHDGISQEVFMLALGLETATELLMRGDSDPAMVARMGSLVTLSKQTLLDTRNLLFDMEHVLTGRDALSALVRHQAAEFATITGITATVDVRGDERPLAPARAGEVYRVMQEGLANVAKHASASAVRVTLAYGTNDLTLSVADSGRGFAHGGGRGGHGLNNIGERAARLGGRLLIDSAPGCGTTITVIIPSAEESDAAGPRAAG